MTRKGLLRAQTNNIILSSASKEGLLRAQTNDVILSEAKDLGGGRCTTTVALRVRSSEGRLSKRMARPCEGFER
jgi:hypothetical protein